MMNQLLRINAMICWLFDKCDNQTEKKGSIFRYTDLCAARRGGVSAYSFNSTLAKYIRNDQQWNWK